jgi:hypothetical protein
MVKKAILLIAPTMVTLFFTVAAHGQEMPAGSLNRLLDCSLNDGVTMAEAVEWARAQPRDDTAPNAIFFRQAVMSGSSRENSDFTIASYYPSYGEWVQRVGAANARPDNRMRTGTRGGDLFTCNPSTLRLNLNRFVNPDNNDGFPGDMTLMTTRFCRVNDGKTIADAWEFAQGVASNFANAGDTSLYQVWTRELGPVGATVAGSPGLILATVPATPEAFGERMDLRREGFDVLEGLRPLPVSCDFPGMWITHAIHRGGNN